MTADPHAAERFAQLEAVLDEALALEPDARDALLLRRCSDPEMLREARELLAAVDASEDFLEHRDLPAEPAAAVMIDQQLGPWRLTGLIGRGGMGEVYRAERDDGQFEQRVAVKLLQRQSAADIRRFLREQKLLARLEHAGIVGLHDAGVTASGRPYMVMEYVDGVDVIAHCRAARLNLEQRLRLFEAICSAVAFAHRNLVVHGDLKPQNILVRQDGRPALLDFGIARLLDEQLLTRTATVGLQMTPGYAAPEQLAGEPATTSTDVYSLGLLLHEMLTGSSPWGSLTGSGALALLKRIDAGPPPPPSSRGDGSIPARQLRGDPDAIVQKALRPEPGARYATVEAFADDVRALLRQDPVQARGDAMGYRLRRMARRYWLASAAGLLLVAGLATALVVVTMAERRAAEQRDAAQVEAARSKAVRDYLGHMFRSASNAQAENTPVTAKQVLEQAAERVEQQFADDPATAAQVLQELGELHLYINDYAGAEPLLRRWLQQEADIADPIAAASVRFALAETLFRLGQVDEAAGLLQQAQAHWLRQPQRHIDELLTSRMLQAQIARTRGDSEAGIAILEQSLPERIARSGELHFETAALHSNLGAAYIQAGRLEAGIEASQRALEAFTTLQLDNGNDALNAMNNLAAAYYRQGDPVAAERYFGQALSVRRSVHGASGATAALIGNYARVLQQRGQFLRALMLAEEAAPMALQFTGEGSPLTLSIGLTRAELLLALQRYPEAEARLRDIDGQLQGPSVPPPLRLRAQLARTVLLRDSGDLPAARAALATSQELAAELGPAAQSMAAQLQALEASLASSAATSAAPSPSSR